MSETFLPQVTLVLGGAASGKSGFAEDLVTRSGRPRVYIATSQAWDDEMRAKIARHHKMRGPDWQTLEVPDALPEVLGECAPNAVVLVDCLTMWLTNRLLAGQDLDTDSRALCTALAACPAPVVLVSNELGQGIVPENALSRRFREAQGRLNQQVAAQADLVVAVMAGLPLTLKGRIPA